MKRCCLIILYVMLASCITHSDNNHNVSTSVSEKSENTLSKEFVQQHNPPIKHKLTSILYELAVAPDPDYFAKQHHILLTKGSVKVFISFDSATSIPEREAMIQNYDTVIEKTAGNLSKAWVPINQLIPLSNEPVIQTITLPKILTPPKDKNHE